MPSLLCSSTPIGCWSSSPAPIAWSTCGPISSSVLSCTAAYRWRRAVMPEERALITFRSVSFAYPGATEPAVREVTLEVRDGEMLAVVGANGSGKSTLGRLANALLLPMAGTVSVDGVATASPQGTLWARQRVGMVFQNPDASIVSASVEEDVAFALENRALPRHVIAERVARVLELLGLAGHRQAHPLELSTSDRARLGLAGVVVGDPRYPIIGGAPGYL